MTEINGRNYVAPGAYVPGGDPTLRYLKEDTKLNIETNFPAADFPGFTAFATDLQVEITSNGATWEGTSPEAVSNKATDFSTINDVKYPSVKAVDDKINAVLGVVAGFVESITLIPLDVGLGTSTYRIPYNFLLSDVRAYLYDDDPLVNDQAVDILNNGVSILSTPITIYEGATSSLEGPVSNPGDPWVLPVISAATLLNDDKITIDASGERVVVIIVGTRL